MTQYFAVVDNNSVQSRSKFADDYVAYGTAKQMLKEVERIGLDNVTIYKVTNTPEVVDYEDTTLKAKYERTLAGAKDKIEGFLERYDVPRTKEGAKAKFEKVKAQALQEGVEAGTEIATTLVIAFQMGKKDPKGLLDTAKKGALAKAKGVQGRLGEFLTAAKDDAVKTSLELEQDGALAAAEAVNTVIGANPDAMKLQDGRKVVRTAYLLVDNNATKVNVATLKKAATPAARKKQGAAPK